MARRAANGNNKGGSGKTGITINTAASMAERGLRVLLVDLDPQGNLTRRMGYPFDPDNPLPGTPEAIKDGGEGVAASVILPCRWGGIYSERIRIIPSRFDLENRVAEAGVVGAVSRFRRAMIGVDEDDDVTMVDLQHVCGVVDPEIDGIEGAIRLRNFVRSYAADLGNPDLNVAGFIVSRYRSNINAHSYQVENLPDSLGAANILDPIMPERSAVKDAADTAQPLRSLGTAGGRETAALFDTLTTDYLKRIGL
jgi:cellulose biosynthesis protein BcsQ